MWNKLITSGCAAVILVCGPATTADAQAGPRNDRAVYFTFSQPVALPQVTLPPGRYLFRLAESLATRQIVQVFDGDGKKMHAMFLTMPTERMDFPKDPEIRFLESAASEPPAVATYWYPGQKSGWEFIYPREQAARLARSSKRPVLTTATNASADEMRTATLTRVSPSGESVSLNTTDAPASGETARGEIAAANTPDIAAPVTRATPPRQTAMAQDTTARTQLPKTASWTPTLLIAGLAALCASFGLARWRRRLES